MKRINIVFLSLLFAINTNAQSKDAVGIRAVINEQVAAWNAGDMHRYMNTYWRNDSLMFIGKEIEVGWDLVSKNYRQFYPDAASMGKLEFEIVNLKKLSKFYYSVVGKWHLKWSTKEQRGTSTLLFKKVKNKWVITQDHSS